LDECSDDDIGFSGLGNGRGIILGSDGEIQQLPLQDDDDDNGKDFGVVQQLDNIDGNFNKNEENKDDNIDFARDEYDDDFDN
jgi:hypothetical protein